MNDQKTASSGDLGSLRIDRDARPDPLDTGRRAFLWAAGAGAVLLMTVAGAALLARRPPEVSIATVQVPPDGGKATILNASGYVTPRLRATVAAKVTGRVAEVLVDEGMEVSSGQVLARLDDADARRRLAAAEAELRVAEAALDDLEVQYANARREMARARALQEAGVGSVQALDQTEMAADSLEARIGLARERVVLAEAQAGILRQDLENYVIRAPFSGVAVSKDAQPGEMVSPISAGGGFTRTGISTIVDMASLEVEVDVNESYIARVTSGQEVEATLDAYPEWRIPARVRTVIPTADRQRATVKVRISFDRLDPRILPDMGVKVAFLERSGAEQVGAARGVVPQAAVRREGDQAVVFVVADGRAGRRAVSLGRNRGGEVEILAGVEAGMRVVTAGPAELRDGQRVRLAAGAP